MTGSTTMFQRLGRMAVVSVASLALAAGAQDGSSDPVYDVVVINGRVLDPETGLDAVRNVAISNGAIVEVTEKPIVGRRTIDAAGHVVAPGFIDMHHHNTAVPFGQRLALRDGVTTPMELEAGVYPIEEWYAALDGRSQTNFGASVGTVPVRERVLNPDYRTQTHGDFLYDMQCAEQAHTSMKWSTQVATRKQIQQIYDMLEKGLEQGAIGIGHCPGYMVAGVTTWESALAQQLAGKHGVSTFVHGRYSSQKPPSSGLLGISEMMGPQASYGGGVVIQHITAQTLDPTPQALDLIDAARNQGVRIIAEIYPYDFGGTIVGADYLHPDNYGPNMSREYKDIIEISTMKPLTKERYEELVKSAPETSVLFYNATEDTVHAALAHPGTVLGSDAFPYTVKSTGKPAIDWDTPFDGVNGHPRGAGAHARLLRLVREKKVDIPLIDAVSKMSYLIAAYLEQNGIDQMATKGRIQVGADADLVIFDPDTVTDNATKEQGGLPSTGIPYVLVNGTVVVEDSAVLRDVYPGQPIRRAPAGTSAPAADGTSSP